MLEGSQIQDLADLVPRLMEASAGSDLRFHVRVALEGDASPEIRAALDEMLAAEVSKDLKTDAPPPAAPGSPRHGGRPAS